MKHKKAYLIIGILVCISLIGIATKDSFSDPMNMFDASFLAYEPTNSKKVSIQKKETSESIFYQVEDYERDLSYTWEFKKDQTDSVPLEESLNIDTNLRLDLDAFTKDTEAIHEKVDQKKLIISFDYHGQLPKSATVKINVNDRFLENEHLYLYYYNPEKDQIEYIQKDVVVQNGYVTFTIDHCSDYFLTAAVVNDAVNNPQSVNYIIIGLIVIVFILVAITVIQSKK